MRLGMLISFWVIGWVFLLECRFYRCQRTRIYKNQLLGAARFPINFILYQIVYFSLYYYSLLIMANVFLMYGKAMANRKQKSSLGSFKWQGHAYDCGVTHIATSKCARACTCDQRNIFAWFFTKKSKIYLPSFIESSFSRLLFMWTRFFPMQFYTYSSIKINWENLYIACLYSIIEVHFNKNHWGPFQKKNKKSSRYRSWCMTYCGIIIQPWKPLVLSYRTLRPVF
jgi:hypothetical protein